MTEQAAELFGQVADALRVREIEAPAAANFLMKIIFCLFAFLYGPMIERHNRRISNGSIFDVPRRQVNDESLDQELKPRD